MGNCCMRHGHDSNMVWAGDDWGSQSSERFTSRESSRHYSDEKPKKMMRSKIQNTEYDLEAEEENNKETCEKQRSSSLLFVDEDDHNKKNVMMNSSTEVKVKITKKQLEELLGNVQVKGLSVQELLGQLMNVTNTTSTTHDSKHRSWRPVLQSIPETMEAISDQDSDRH